MMTARRPKRRIRERVPNVQVGGMTDRLIRELDARNRELKGQLATLRADFAEYLYKHSEPTNNEV